MMRFGTMLWRRRRRRGVFKRLVLWFTNSGKQMVTNGGKLLTFRKRVE